MNLKSISLSIALLSIAACSPNLAKNDRAVLGGENARANSLVAKSTVALGMKSDDTFAPFCTGTIVSTNLILTATHCLAQFEGDYSEIVLYFGNSLDNYSHELERTIEQGSINPNYKVILDSVEDFITGVNDVALIKINGVIPDTSTPASIIDENLKLNNDSILTLAGWGVTDDQEGDTPSVLQYADVTLKKYWATHLITNQTEGKGACAGDSGGPAYIRQNDQLVVVGATRGPHMPAFDCSSYGEYTNLSLHKAFILETAKSLNAQEPTFIIVTESEVHEFDRTPPTDFDLELIPEEDRNIYTMDEVRQNEVIDESDITTRNEYSDEGAAENEELETNSDQQEKSESLGKEETSEQKASKNSHISVTAVF